MPPEKPFQKLATFLHNILIAILVAIPLGLYFVLYEASENGGEAEGLGILLIIMIPFEIFLGLIFFWLRVLRTNNINKTSKLIQLILIIFIGILPGLILIYPLFNQ